MTVERRRVDEEVRADALNCLSRLIRVISAHYADYSTGDASTVCVPGADIGILPPSECGAAKAFMKLPIRRRWLPGNIVAEATLFAAEILIAGASLILSARREQRRLWAMIRHLAPPPVSIVRRFPPAKGDGEPKLRFPRDCFLRHAPLRHW